jgi:hypothetical protein
MDKKTIQIFEDIKKLLILDLIVRGTQGKEIAGVLGVDPATISRMVPTKQVKKK